MDITDPKIDALLLIAGLEVRRDHTALARDYYEQALRLATQTCDSKALSVINHELGMLLQKEGKFFDAEQHYVRSLELCLQLNDDDGAARTTGQLGTLKELQDDYPGAFKQYLIAQGLFAKINSPLQEQAIRDLIRVGLKMRDLEENSGIPSESNEK